jgi:hypothetical protein
MTSFLSEFLVAIDELAALQVRFGLLAVGVAASSVKRMVAPPHPESGEPADRISDVQVDAAARAIRAKLFGCRDGGFQNMLRINFPDDDIRAMAEAALTAAHQAKRLPAILLV